MPAPGQADAPLATSLIRCASKTLLQLGTWDQGQLAQLGQTCNEKSSGMAALYKIGAT